MAREIKSGVLRYLIAIGAFVLLIALTYAIPRVLPVNLDLTWLIIITMIAAAWYLGRGPGLLFAVLFEATLIFFAYSANPQVTLKSALITFNRLVLFGSVVLFASSRRNAEKKLREQQELLQVTLESIGDAVIATDIDGKINFINPTAEALTGWKISEVAGKNLEDVFNIVNEKTRQPVENPFTVVTREGVIVGLANHTILITRDNREIPIEDSGAPIRDADGNIIGVIIVFHDVSERRRAEQERERLLESEQSARGEAETANRLKDDFLATVSHELRTPLNAILGWSAMLSRSPFEEKNVRNALEVIERNAKFQAEIISDILDVSSIITGKLRIESKPIELAPIIQSAVETLRPASDAKSIKLKTSFNSNGGLVLGDSNRLQQIIWNLVSNAIKFTPENGNIEIRLEQVNSHLEIIVSDNGIGIDEQFLPYVFERFRQADASTTRADRGLGLGLAIVRHLVELHGGTISAESEGDGKGSTFVIRLPAASVNEGNDSGGSPPKLNQAETDGNSDNAPDLSGLRVLVVDDDPDTLGILHLMLSGYGAEVKSADSASDALEIFLKWKPNVLVSDIGMPGEDGFMLIDKIRALSPEKGGTVPAAALTAYAGEEDRLKALAAGFQTHIPKPVEPTTLVSAVELLAKQANKN